MNQENTTVSAFSDEVLASVARTADRRKKKAIASFASGQLVRLPLIGESLDTIIARGVQDCFENRRCFSLAAIAELSATGPQLRTLLELVWSGEPNYLMAKGHELAVGSAADLAELVDAVTFGGWADLDVDEHRELNPPLLAVRLKLANAADTFARHNPRWSSEAVSALQVDTGSPDDDELDEDSAIDGLRVASARVSHSAGTEAGEPANPEDPSGTSPTFTVRDDGLEHRPDATALRLVSLATILSRPSPRREVVCGPFLERGVVTLFVAPPGAGKTTAATRAAVAIAQGVSWAGFEVPEPGVVIYLNAEETHDELSRRFQGAIQNAGLDADADADAIGRVKMINQEGALRLMSKVDGRPQISQLARGLRELIIEARPAAVILDPLALLHDLDENLNADMTALLEHLHEVARTARCAILLVHHARKDVRAVSMDVARGASSLAASARAMFVLSEIGDNPHDDAAPAATVALTCVKSNNHPRTNETALFYRGSVRLESGDEVGTLIPADRTQQPVRRRTAR